MHQEKLAVSHVVELLSWCESLDPNIEFDDKIINSDGQVQIYSGQDHKKSTHLGHAQIQVKGRRWSKKIESTASYKAEVEELRGYLKERGLVLVLVLINEKKRIRAPYYIVLTPFKIMDFIAKAGTQKSLTLLLSELPTDPEQLTGIFKFSRTAQQEDPQNYAKPLTPSGGSSLQVITPESVSFDKPLILDRSRADLDFTVFHTNADGLRTPIDGAFTLIPPTTSITE